MNNTTYKVESTVGQLGDFAKEYWTDEDHAAWNKQVEEWKASGEYGKSFTIEMTLIHNPDLDDKSYTWPEFPFSSTKMDFLDFSKN